MSGNNPISVAKPKQSTNGPVFMPRPVQGYQPTRTVDYSYKPQYTPARQIPQPQWAIPQYPAPAMGMPEYNYQIGDIDYRPKGQIYNEDGQQIGGPRFNSDGMYIGTWESGLSDGT